MGTIKGGKSATLQGWVKNASILSVGHFSRAKVGQFK
jgi:hypothetical protein